MNWRVVHIKESEYIKTKLGNLEVLKAGEKTYIPLSDISIIVLEGNRTSITTKLLSSLSKHNIVLVICDDKYMPTGIYTSYTSFHRSAKRAQEQALWSDELKNEMWREIITQKIFNQYLFAQYKNADSRRLDVLMDLMNNVESGDKSNREGHAAKVYFNSIYDFDFSRENICIENIAMNYGYSIIRTAIARCAVGQGLLTMLGIFHCNEYNSFNLVDDLMEPFRPLMDFWLNKEVLGKEDFLSYQSRLKLIDFINQPMLYNGKNSTVNQVMQKYVNSFVKAMHNSDMSLLHKVSLEDFINGGKK